ncbi:MAG: uroporphyrinogen decarboxylase family protein [Kiritimatiellae bacterium]|nr:uroporphyrinogen decarboxylase family protein [Kiritimatiellia bacterium]
MNSRERTFLVLRHKPADRIPIDFWASTATVSKIERETGMSHTELLDRYDVDLRYIEGPRYVGPPLPPGEDIWGVRRSSVRIGSESGGENYQEVTAPPLTDAESVDEVLAYPHWPDPKWYDYSMIAAQCESVRRENRVVVFMGDRLNRVAQLKPAMYLRGADNIFLDMLLRPEMARAIFGRIKEFYLEYLESILEAAAGGIDMVVTGDDFGAQTGMLISPEMWREFLMPGFREYLGLIRDYNAVTVHHTCGAVTPIIPDMIECGLDVLQSVQPEAAGMTLRALQARFGDKLCFHGGISIQKTLPFGSPEDVRREVREIASLFKDTGGYIFCTAHNIQADTPVRNIVALLEAYHEFGRR